MGAVFLAQQSRPKRQVAVKVLLPMRPLNPNQLAAFLERFRRETDAAASMEHPNIIPVHEYGERAGLAYLVMPYVSGGTLRDELERCGTLSLEKVSSYLEQLAAAVDFAHEHGVIHRDIKPANVMITPEGRILLADFGLVKIVDERNPQVRITGVGAPVGTPDYMSPEQVIGEEVDVRADLYSLGVVLYQMITGTTPFHGETPMQIAAQHLQVPPPSAQMMRPDLPIGAEQVLQRALAKRPDDRYRSAQDLANAFRTALVNAGIQLDASYYVNGLLTGSTTGLCTVPKGQFDPMRQTTSMPKVSKSAPALYNTDRQPAIRGSVGSMLVPALSPDPPHAPREKSSRKENSPVAQTSASCSVQPDISQRQNGGGLLSRTGKFPMVGTGTSEVVHAGASQIQTGKWVVNTASPVAAAIATAAAGPAQDSMLSSVDASSTVGSLPRQGTPVETSLSPLVSTEAVGTCRGCGLSLPACTCPVAPLTRGGPDSLTGMIGREPASSLNDPTRNLTLTPRMKIMLLVAAVVLIAVGLVGFLWFTHHAHTPPQSKTVVTTIYTE
jgi:serine/threonine protein kinase